MSKNNNLVKSGLLLAIAIIFQLIGKALPQVSQFLVGPIVNAILILTVLICGLWYGIALGVLTPVLAWILGQLAAPFGPFIPFIIIGNAIFVIIFYLLKNIKYGQYAGIIAGAFLKFAFLFVSAKFIAKALNLIPAKLLSKLAFAMGVPQLITGLIGGVIAIILYTLLKNRKQVQ